MTTLSLDDLINLSFGNCELKTMKFRVLKWSLQILIHQLSLGNILIEFRGGDSLFIQNEINSATEALRSKMCSSFIGKKKELCEGIDQVELNEKKKNKKEVMVIENGKLIVCPDIKNVPFRTTALARIEGRVRNVQAQLDAFANQMLPSDQDLIKKIRDKEESKPVTNLLQTMKITKRMSGAEQELDKMASLLESVAKEYGDVRQILNRIRKDFGQDIGSILHNFKVISSYINNVRPRETYYHTTLSKRLLQPKSAMRKTLVKTKHRKSLRKQVKIKEFTDNNEEIRRELKIFDCLKPIEKDELGIRFTNTINKLLEQHEQLKLDSEFLTIQVNTLADFAEVLLNELVAGSPNIDILKERIREVHLKPTEYKQTKKMKQDMIDIQMEVCYRIDDIQGDMSKYSGKLKVLENMREESMKSIEDRIDNLQKDIRENTMDLTMIKLDDNNEREEKIDKVDERITFLDGILETIILKTNIIEKDIKSNELILNKLKDDIITIKSIKLDRFEFDELLAEKADTTQLNSKVSQDQFTQAYRYMSINIEKISEKVSEQVILWQKCIENFELALKTKLSLGEFNELAQRLLSDTRKKQEEFLIKVYNDFGPCARGAKTKYIDNMQCISCNNEVSMKKENDYPNIPLMPKLIGHKVKTSQKKENIGSENLVSDLNLQKTNAVEKTQMIVDIIKENIDELTYQENVDFSE